MDWRATTIAALVIWATGTVMVGAGALLLFLNRSTWRDPLAMFDHVVALAPTALVYTTVGVFLFARFPRNALTWVICGIGVAVAHAIFTTEYVLTRRELRPGAFRVLRW